jgi:hypothetical protein
MRKQCDSFVHYFCSSAVCGRGRGWIGGLPLGLIGVAMLEMRFSRFSGRVALLEGENSDNPSFPLASLYLNYIYRYLSLNILYFWHTEILWSSQRTQFWHAVHLLVVVQSLPLTVHNKRSSFLAPHFRKDRSLQLLTGQAASCYAKQRS